MVREPPRSMALHQQDITKERVLNKAGVDNVNELRR